MKVFGVSISGNKPKQEQLELIQDEIPEVKASIPDTKKIAKIKPIKSPGMGYHSQKRIGRGAFQPPEYDLAEIGRIEDTDSYVRQAFNKKVGLMFKEGWDFIGPNLRTIKYIKARFAQMAAASGVPTDQLIREIGSSLVRKSNAFLVKVRDTRSSGGAIRRIPGRSGTVKPVAAYFPLPAETMEFELDGHKLNKWRQKMPDGEYKDHDTIDIVHLHSDRKDGFIFGTPLLIPVIDDIRALRKIEENVEMLVYQHIFPLFHYKVGTETMPAGLTEEGISEVEIVRHEIQLMPSEGSIVTPERHDIKAIGAEGRALRAEGYLEHYKKRVFSGLGVSAVDMGEGETANRATADNMSRNLVDAVKDLQQVVETFVNEFIIKELLLESTFGEDALAEENIVRLKFKEIDTEAKIKKEAHAADLFAKYAINHDELRAVLGHEPLKLPSAEEVEQDIDISTLYPEWARMKWKLFDEPKLLIQSIDEPYSPAAKAATKTSSVGINSGDLDEAREASEQAQEGQTKAKVTQKDIRNSIKINDTFVKDTFVSVKNDVVSRVKETSKIDQQWTATLIRAQMASIIPQLIAVQRVQFRRGYSSFLSIETDEFISDSSFARRIFEERAERYIHKLTENVITSMRRNLNDDQEDLIGRTRAVFESIQFRTEFIEDVEARKAFNYGRAIAMKRAGARTIIINAKEDTSSIIAQSKDGNIYDLSLITIEDVPPFHANDTTTFQVNDEDLDDPSPYIPTKTITSCPKCKKTAIKKDDTPDVYNCRACRYSFRVLEDTDEIEDICSDLSNSLKEEVEENPEDATLEECVLSVKKNLREEHPDWDEDKIKSSAFAICNSRKKGSD